MATRGLAALAASSGAGVLLLLLSCIATRGTVNICSDMDDPASPLIGDHGYCMQELVNLLLLGRAHSNVFDGIVEMVRTSPRDFMSTLRLSVAECRGNPNCAAYRQAISAMWDI